MQPSRILSLLLLLMPCLAVHGETFIVKQDHPAASDANPGTSARPLKTISAAARKVKAGDKVIIHGGGYREVVIITASGTKDSPIVFEAAPNEKPVIKGSDVISSWTHEEGDIWKTKLPDFPARNQASEEASFWNTNDVRQVFARDGEMFEARPLRRVLSKEAIKAGTFFCDTANLFLYLRLADSGSPLEHPPEVSLRGGWLMISGSYVTVRGISMRHSSTTAIANWPACNLTGANIVMENCTLTWGDFVAVSLAGSRQQLRHSLIACLGNSGLAGTGEDHLIEGCRVIYNNLDRYSPDWHAGGAKFIPKFQRSIVRHCEFAHNLGPGLWLDSECNENILDGNFSHDNEGAGILVEVSRGNLVCNNVSVANRNFLSGSYRDSNGKEEHLARSEERAGPARTFKVYHAGDGRGVYISSSPDTKVMHNTVYYNEGEGICVEGPARGDMTTHGSVVANNISVFNHGAQLTYPSNAATSDYNLLFAVGAVLAKNGWSGEASWSIAEWQRSSQQEAHSLDADPRFAMAAMNDFRLLPESAGLGAGMVAKEVDHDFLGQPRSAEKPSIGAYEAAVFSHPQPAMMQLTAPR